VLKLKNVTFDADYFHIHFDNSYSSVPDTALGGEPIYYLQPSSITQGLEGESNVYLSHGFSVYLNASYNRASYEGTQAVSCTSSASGCTSSTPQYVFTAPGGLYVQQTPTDVEAEGLTYQHKTWDLGFFNKRVGMQYIDNGAGYHNQATVPPFSLANLFLNYTIRSGGLFDQTKLRLSFNNLFNSSSLTGNTPQGTAQTVSLAANNTSYVNPFVTNGPTPVNGGDQLTVLPGRSVSLSIIFGYGPKR
jgi:iron complex outermembrane receptor protein